MQFDSYFRVGYAQPHDIGLPLGLRRGVVSPSLDVRIDAQRTVVRTTNCKAVTLIVYRTGAMTVKSVERPMWYPRQWKGKGSNESIQYTQWRCRERAVGAAAYLLDL